MAGQKCAKGETVGTEVREGILRGATSEIFKIPGLRFLSISKWSSQVADWIRESGVLVRGPCWRQNLAPGTKVLESHETGRDKAVPGLVGLDVPPGNSEPWVQTYFYRVF